MNVWLNYPLSKAVRFMEETHWRLFGHMLRIGPIALCIVWKRKVNP